MSRMRELKLISVRDLLPTVLLLIVIPRRNIEFGALIVVAFELVNWFSVCHFYLPLPSSPDCGERPPPVNDSSTSAHKLISGAPPLISHEIQILFSWESKEINRFDSLSVGVAIPFNDPMRFDGFGDLQPGTTGRPVDLFFWPKPCTGRSTGLRISSRFVCRAPSSHSEYKYTVSLCWSVCCSINVQLNSTQLAPRTKGGSSPVKWAPENPDRENKIPF